MSFVSMCPAREGQTDEKKLSGRLLDSNSNMNSSLIYGIVLMVLYVLNTVVVASNVNTRNSNGNGQTHLKNHNMVILMISWGILINQYFNDVGKPKKWKCTQCAKVYNITTIPVVQISNKESMHLENERIRLLQSNSMINTMQPKKNSYTKMMATNMSKSTLSISLAAYGSTFKLLMCRYITVMKDLIEKKYSEKKREVYVYQEIILKKQNKNSNKLENCELDVIASTTQSNDQCKLCKRSRASIGQATFFAVKYIYQ
ncbi:hypothetical protein RFI_32605, partial [Reticulomyxa filosa]